MPCALCNTLIGTSTNNEKHVRLIATSGILPRANGGTGQTFRCEDCHTALDKPILRAHGAQPVWTTI